MRSDIEEYKKRLDLATETYGVFAEHVQYRMNKDGTPMPLPFVILGLGGESGELVAEMEKPLCEWRRDLVKSELGDVLWYLQAYLSYVGKGVWINHITSVATGDSFMVSIGKVLEAGKKLAWHGRVYTPDQLTELVEPVVAHLNDLAALVGVTFEEAMAGNIEKLEKRYPRGFVEGGGVR